MTATVSAKDDAFAAATRNERRYALAAFCTLLGITAGHTLLETARDALFLARLPASRLPWVYLGIAAVGVLLAQVDRGKQGRWGMAAALGAAAAVNVGFWALIDAQRAWTLYALYLWTGLFASWVVVQFWLFLGQLFTMTQAKRLYSFIGTGSVLGALVGAAGARGLTMVLDARNLLLGSAAVLVVTGVPCVVLLRAEIEEPPVGQAQVMRAPSLLDDVRAVGGHPYVRRILWLVLTSTVALTIVDYLFKSSVVKHVPPAQMGSFFATVYTVLNALALMAQLVLVNWVLRLTGVHRALRVVPILVLAGALYGVVAGGMIAVLLLKGLDGSLRHSLHRTTMELLYVPLPNALRRQAKPFIDLAGQRGGQALASMVILALVILSPEHDRPIKIFLLVLAVLWLCAAAGLKQHYLDLFRATLREGALDTHGELPPLDQDALETLFFALNSSRDSEVLAALDLLSEQRRARLIPALVLYHPSNPVVLRAFDLFVRAGRADFVPIADRLMVDHTYAEVRTAALRARTMVRPDEKLLRSVLAEATCPEMRATALVSLIWRGWMPPEEAHIALEKAATGASLVVRLALARALRQQPSPESEAVMITLAQEGEPEVWVELAYAMAKLKNLTYLPALLPMLENREARSAAREALAAIGEPALAFLVDALEDTSLPHGIRRQIPRAIADFDAGPAAKALLLRLIPERDGTIRYRILRALGRIRRTHPDLALDRATLAQATDETVRGIFQHLDWRVTLEQGAKDDPARLTTAQQVICALLKDKEAHGTERLFRLHGLVVRGEDFARIFRGLKNRSAKARASSRELIENLLTPPLRDWTLAIVDDAPDAERLARAAPLHVRSFPRYETVLREILDQSDDTLRSLVAYHVGELGIVSMRGSVAALQVGQDGFVAGVVERARALLDVAHKPATVT